jgi:hypothetical protein
MHAWLGGAAANAAGESASNLPLTDDERLLRDLAYPLIEPPYDRNRWYSILNEYGISRSFGGFGFNFDVTSYHAQLIAQPFRSANSRHAQLNDDVRNDVVRIAPFFLLARQVLDIDAKREKSIAYVATLSVAEVADARARNAENALIVGWVQCSLAERAAAYRFALEHLVVMTPTPAAVEVERSVKLMQATLAESRLVRDPVFCPAEFAPLVAAPAGKLIVK